MSGSDRQSGDAGFLHSATIMKRGIIPTVQYGVWSMEYYHSKYRSMNRIRGNGDLHSFLLYVYFSIIVLPSQALTQFFNHGSLLSFSDLYKSRAAHLALTVTRSTWRFVVFHTALYLFTSD